MKSKEQIEQKLHDLQQDQGRYDIEIAYLQIALTHREYYIRHLWNKYNWEVDEDKKILEILNWVLGYE